MLTIPNLLSLIRAPLALLFLQDNVMFRCIAIILALLTDCLDGYLARRYQSVSRFGTLLDPMMDKFFVFTVLAVLIQEQHLSLWEAAAMIVRDFSVILFGFYLIATNKWTGYQFRSIWCGKVTTTLQLFVLLGLTLHYKIPMYIFIVFIALGVLALIELSFSIKAEKLSKPLTK